MFDHFLTLCMKGLIMPMISIYLNTFQYSVLIAEEY